MRQLEIVDFMVSNSELTARQTAAALSISIRRCRYIAKKHSIIFAACCYVGLAKPTERIRKMNQWKIY